ncbi:MAG TPA: VIT1/CCC1 transporter family protein [Burkholderiaceae bacterium]|nr:VIT1/CCC1 transporter family protein [Burkholderiaceae bacterium]
MADDDMSSGPAVRRHDPLTDDPIAATGRSVLDPIDRISEVLFGLFMVLTFTGALSVLDSGRDEVRSMLVAAIGCNIAWGFVDAVMYVLRNMVGRGRKLRLIRAVRDTAKDERAHRLIGDEIGPLAAALDAADLERVRNWLAAQPAHALPSPTPTRSDLRGALAVFLLVFLSTFPVVLPFFFIADAGAAKRASAAVAIAMLFACGYAWGRYAGFKAWRSGLVMVALGIAVEAIVIALGG